MLWYQVVLWRTSSGPALVLEPNMADETDQTSSRLPRIVMGIGSGRSHANLRQRFAAAKMPMPGSRTAAKRMAQYECRRGEIKTKAEETRL
jgi:hypothetical protein